MPSKTLLALVAAAALSSCLETPPNQLTSNTTVGNTGASDIPLVGRSLFDAVTAVGQGGSLVQVVPYPFTDLVAQLGARVDTAPVTVLFPGGRSLQRNAAGAQKFAKPRIVLALTGEALPGNATTPELLLKNRLYVGFTEAAAQMEVISYNEDAGRFEFQIVENYGPGLKPEVKYAARRFCGACHQNSAPIFSAAPWDETNANPDISALLQQAMPNQSAYFGVPLSTVSAVPYNFDLATQDANLLSGYQTLWRSGCGTAGGTDRCRRLALSLALTYRATGTFDVMGAAYSEFSQLSTAAWQANLPQGVAIPVSEIKNFNPLKDAITPGSGGAGAQSDPDLAKLTTNSHIPADREPLTPRPTPLEQWTLGASDNVRLIYALADIISDRDLALLQNEFGSDLGSASSKVLDATVGDPLFAANAYGRCTVLRVLFQGSKTAAPNCAVDLSKLPPPAIAALGSDLATSDPSTAPFSTYCGVCHSSGPYPFLAGGTVQQIKSDLGANAAEHIRRLSWESGVTQPMPPGAAPEHMALAAHPEVRQQMIDALKSWQQ